MATINKKGQGVHMWGATDIFIIIMGIAIGFALVYFLRDQSFIQNLICSAPATPPAPTP